MNNIEATILVEFNGYSLRGYLLSDGTFQFYMPKSGKLVFKSLKKVMEFWKASKSK